MIKATNYFLKWWLISNECEWLNAVQLSRNQVFRNDALPLLCAEDSDSTLVEAMWIFLGGDVKVNSEDEVRPCEVQVHWQSHLQQKANKI